MWFVVLMMAALVAVKLLVFVVVVSGDGGGVRGLHQEVGVCLARDDLLPSVDWLIHWLTPELLQFPDQLGLHPQDRQRERERVSARQVCAA